MLKQSIVAMALTFALAGGAYAATSAPKEPATSQQHHSEAAKPEGHKASCKDGCTANHKKDAAKPEKAATAPAAAPKK